MFSHSGLKNVIRAAVVSGAAFSGVVLFVSGAVAAGPNAHVTPDKHLTNDKVVTVTGSGFTPGAIVAILECNRRFAVGGGQATCDIPNVVSATVTTAGKVPATNFTVRTGTIGNGKCITSKQPTRANWCFIVVTNKSNTKQVAGVQILFQPR